MYINLFMELSAFDTNAKSVKAFVLRKSIQNYPKSA